MSGSSRSGYSRKTSSLVAPWAIWPTITDTGMRIPRMQALPPMICGLKVIRSNMAIGSFRSLEPLELESGPEGIGGSLRCEAGRGPPPESQQRYEYRKYRATFHASTFHGTPAGASQQPAGASPAPRRPPPPPRRAKARPALPAQTGRRPGDGQPAPRGLLQTRCELLEEPEAKALATL